MKKQIGYKRIQIVMHDLLEEKPNKKIHTFSLNPEVVIQFKKTCGDKYSMSSVVEEMMEAFIETHQNLKSGRGSR